MILFWVVSGVLVAAALFLLLRPLLRQRAAAQVSRRTLNIAVYRDQLRELEADLRAGTLAQADYDRAQRELEARLLEDVDHQAGEVPRRHSGRALTVLLAIAVPTLALAVYFLVGSPAAIDPEAAQAASARQVEAMVGRLAARLKDNPDDVEGWKMLGRSYSVLGRFPEAADAYAKAAARAPRDAQLLADFAEALGMAHGQRLQGDPEKLIARALELDANNLKALALAGTAAFGRKDYKAAAAYWERMLPLVPQDSEDARAIRSSVDEARALLGSTKALKGTVGLSPRLKGKVAPEDTVFIFARAAEGPPMPLAVLRKQVRDLPLAFSLDDSMAMAPGAKLSGFPRVVVTARVSKSGSATPQPGDLQGASAIVANDATGVAVLIDGVR
jgi:cytochrome c-type biogenesis protein CcmH